MMELCVSEDKAGEIATDLINIGCCPRCVLRFLGEKQLSVYKQNAEEIRCILQNFIQSTVTFAATLCPVCLGILQKFTSREFLSTIKELVISAGYEFLSYQCSLQLPVCLLVRQHSLFLYLKNAYSDYESICEEDVASVKDVWKWFSGHHLNELLAADFRLKSPFDISVTFQYDSSDRECTFLLDLDCGIVKRKGFKQRNHELFNRTNVGNAVKNMESNVFKQYVQCPPSIPSSACSVKLACSHDSIFVAGRYMKYSRKLSQTPWILDGERKMERSVQELICQTLLENFKPTDHKFSSSGREDVDVRMLGTGRPFVVELIDPHRIKFSPSKMWSMQQKINKSTSDVAVRDLQIVSRGDIDILKVGEEEKTKSYLATCWSPDVLKKEELDKLSEIQDLKLNQKTPVRVLHRRPLAVRERVVHSLKAEQKDDHYFTLEMSTQAGTYVKEFVHGDFGRTQPNLSVLLGHECDILELDVMSVDINWPPHVSVPADMQLEDSNISPTDEPSQNGSIIMSGNDQSIGEQSMLLVAGNQESYCDATVL